HYEKGPVDPIVTGSQENFNQGDVRNNQIINQENHDDVGNPRNNMGENRQANSTSKEQSEGTTETYKDGSDNPMFIGNNMGDNKQTRLDSTNREQFEDFNVNGQR